MTTTPGYYLRVREGVPENEDRIKSRTPREIVSGPHKTHADALAAFKDHNPRHHDITHVNDKGEWARVNDKGERAAPYHKNTLWQAFKGSAHDFAAVAPVTATGGAVGSTIAGLIGAPLAAGAVAGALALKGIVGAYSAYKGVRKAVRAYEDIQMKSFKKMWDEQHGR